MREDEEDDRGETRFQLVSLAIVLGGFAVLFAVEFWAALKGVG